MHVELRAFQREILELARETNVVMVGETGIGKTFLAIALLTEQDYSGRKRAFFMAPTRQLVVQITAKIRQMSTLRANAYCGRNAADLWDGAQWARELELTRVFVCTPEVVRNVLLKGYVTLEQMNLLVFDECHHVTKRHPYAQIVKLYNDEDAGSMPRIFGTTACPTRLCAEKLRAQLKKVTLDQTQVKEFAATAPLVYEEYPPQEPWAAPKKLEEEVGIPAGKENQWVFDYMMAELRESKAVEVYEKLVKKGKSSAANDSNKLDQAKKKFIQSCLTIYKNLGPWCYYRFVELEIHRLAIAASLLITIPGSMHGLDSDAVKTILLLTGKRESCEFACTNKVSKAVQLVREQLFEKSTEISIAGSSNEDVEEGSVVAEDDDDYDDDESELTDDDVAPNDTPDQLVTETESRPLQGILFVNTRSECRVLTDFLNEKFAAMSGEDEVVEPDTESLSGSNFGIEEAATPPFACILGRASRNDTASFYLPKMERTLADYESGAVRILVSTSVSVEGVDFPQCGLIVVMDRVNTARSLIQLRGRARHQDGVVYYLGEENDLAQAVHLKQLLKESDVINRLEFSTEKSETLSQQPRSISAKAIGMTETQLHNKSTGAVLDLDSAIPCVNMFCQSLPARLFTVDLKNMFKFTEMTVASRPVFVAQLTLPEELELPPVNGDPMTSKAGAKASAAFNGCRQLLEGGYLDESFTSIYRASKTKASANAHDLSYFINRLHT